MNNLKSSRATNEVSHVTRALRQRGKPRGIRPSEIEDQMQFKAKEPIDAGLASSSQTLEHAVRNNPTVVTDAQRGAVYEANPAARSELSEEVSRER